MITVRFLYLTGLKMGMFHRARLVGSWNGWVARWLMWWLTTDVQHFWRM
jgi:hypothetical protein